MDAVNKQHLDAQLFIDGKFVDAASGKTMDHHQPRDRRRDRQPRGRLRGRRRSRP
ncbi:MAG: hypothetical protein WDN30_00050 [Pararobbsia sp.]